MAEVRYRPGVPRLVDWAEDMLRGYMDEAGVPLVEVNSTTRTVEQQVSAMYDNEHNDKHIAYGRVGRKVIDVITQMWDLPKSTVVAEGSRVFRDESRKSGAASYHVAEFAPDGYAAVDIQPSSIDSARYRAFFDALKAGLKSGKLKELLSPDVGKGNKGYDPALHVVFVRDKTAQVAAAVTNLATGGDASTYEGEDDEDVPYMATGTFLLLVGAGVGGWLWWRKRHPRRNPGRPPSGLPSGASRALRLRRSRR